MAINILANPGHGNGPTVSLLQAAEAYQQVARQPVNMIIADMGPFQHGVIERRCNPQCAVTVYFDRRLGVCLNPVTLQNNDFAQNVRNIIQFQQASQRMAREYIAGGLTTTALDGSARYFPADDLSFELNHGSRIRFMDHAYYFFPCLLSDLLRYADGLPEGDRCSALALVEELEAGYNKLFLPFIHTFSWDKDWQPKERVAFIPFPRPVVIDPTPLSQQGILVMPSGAGSKGNALLIQAVSSMQAQAREMDGTDLAIYSPTNSRLPELPDAVEINPAAIAHANIDLVIGRAGWGTIWECLNAGKPFVAIPALAGDDPEIAYNLCVLESSGLGIVWQGQPGAYRQLREVKTSIAACMADIERRFGTRDGLVVMAQAILQTPHAAGL